MSSLVLALAFLSTAVSGARNGSADYHMDRLWVLDPDSTVPLIGYVEDAVIDAAGTVYLLDAQLAEIKVVASDGRIMRVLGGRGEGPGELRAPGEIFFFPDSSLGVVSKLNGELKRIDPVSGIELASYRLDGKATDSIVTNQVLATPMPTGPILVATVREWTGVRYGTRTSLAVLRFAENSHELNADTRILLAGEYQDDVVEEENYYLLWQPWTVDSLGRVVAAPHWDSYRIRWFDPYGDVLQESHWPLPERERTDAERNRLLALWGGTDPEPVNGLRLRVADRAAAVRSIYRRPGGKVWVRTNRAGLADEDGVFMELDEIDSSGVLGGRVRLLGPGSEQDDHVYWGSDGLIVVVHNGETSNPWARPHDAAETLPPFAVACYRLVRGEPTGEQ